VDLDKAPYFVTLALALFGWSANHVVNRITDAPTLEYRIEEPKEEKSTSGQPLWTQNITLTNLTRKQTFENLSVMLIARKGSTLASDQLKLRPVPPAFEGDDSWESEGGRATFTVPKLHPGSSVQVVSAYTGDKPPVFRIKSQGTVFATKANWETWFVRHEIYILTPLALVWAMVISVYAYSNLSLYRKPDSTLAKRHVPLKERRQ
jgi:hypothetical protein